MWWHRHTCFFSESNPNCTIDATGVIHVNDIIAITCKLRYNGTDRLKSQFRWKSNGVATVSGVVSSDIPGLSQTVLSVTATLHRANYSCTTNFNPPTSSPSVIADASTAAPTYEFIKEFALCTYVCRPQNIDSWTSIGYMLPTEHLGSLSFANLKQHLCRLT